MSKLISNWIIKKDRYALHNKNSQILCLNCSKQTAADTGHLT